MSFQFSARISKAACIFALVLASATSVAEDATQYELNIAPQNIEQALRKLAEITGKELLFLFDQMESLESEQISGTYTIEDALAIILENTSLSGELTQDGVILITPKQKESAGSAMDVKKAGLIAVVVGALTGGANAQEPAVTEQEIQTSVVTGKVTDARTGANLKGAKVTIEETGQWTSTNDLGEFRFVNVPTGSATLTVSFLGYAGQTTGIAAHGEGTSQDFALRGGSEMEEIVVFGQRSARAQALNLERTAENVATVLATDFLGQIDGTTISETLRRAPGISFVQSEVTGDGTNIVVRGLEPDLNQISLNGLRLPEGSGVGRSADLSDILTESVSSITINKTLLPMHDSYGTGGLVEIETKSPLDRDRRFANFSLQGSQRDNDFGDEFLLSSTLSGTFGPQENWGVSASIQYRDQDVRRLAYSVDANTDNPGQYLPVDSDGEPIPRFPINFIDPQTPFPFEPGVDKIYPNSVSNSASGANSRNLSLTLSGEWQATDSTNLRFDYFRTDSERDTYGRSTQISVLYLTELLPIDELGGEERWANVSEDVGVPFGLPPGIFMGLGRQSYSAAYDSRSTSDSISLRGQTDLDDWTFRYVAGFSQAETETPLSASMTVQPDSSGGFASLVLDPAFIGEAMRDNTVAGRIVHPYSPIGSSSTYPLPLLNQDGFDYFNDPANYFFETGQITTGSSGKNERKTLEFSVRRNFESGALSYIEAGVFYEEADFQNPPIISGADRLFILSTVPIQDLGFDLSGNDFDDIGVNTGFGVIPQSSLDGFFRDIDSALAASPGLVANPIPLPDERLQDRYTREENLAAYLQASVSLGNLELVGGFRYDSIDVSARNLISASLVDANGAPDLEFQERTSRLVNQSASQTRFLPRLAGTYRFSEDLMLRFGYGKSVARPRINDLSKEQRVSVNLVPGSGPNFDQPTLTVNQGNPNLKPTVTNSYDLSLEYYTSSIGQIKVSAFFKEIDNLLERSGANGAGNLQDVVLPDDPRIASNLDDFFVTVITPTNNDDPAEIWGVELAVEQQFSKWPGFWSGFGVYANYTYTESSKTAILEAFNPLTFSSTLIPVKDQPFSGDPQNSGTFAITYSEFGFDGILAYTAQDRSLQSVRSFGLSSYSEVDDTLDFRMEYRFDALNGAWQLWFEAADILKSQGDPDVITSIGGENGVPKYFTNANYFGGREFRLGVRTTF